MKWLLGVALAFATVVGLSACVVHTRRHPHGHAEWVHVAGHVHDAGCGHYQWRGRWHVHPGAHRHAHGCGHVFRGGFWHMD